MAAIQQITIHPREIPPRRKFDTIPKSPFKRPFEPPRRVGDFPLPDPPPFQVELSKPKSIQKRDAEKAPDGSNSRFAFKQAVRTYEADPEKIRHRKSKGQLLPSGNLPRSRNDDRLHTLKASPSFAIKKFQSVQNSWPSQPSPTFDLLA